MSTPEQHEALFLEILREMTPAQVAEQVAEQVAAALKPVDLTADLPVSPEPGAPCPPAYLFAERHRLQTAFRIPPIFTVSL